MTSWVALIVVIQLLARITIPGIPNIPTVPNLPKSIPIPPLAKLPPDSIVVQPAGRLAQVALLDAFEPARYSSLADLPRDAQGAISLVPGAFELLDQSFCLRAGGHGPNASSAYSAGVLSGTRAGYVRDVLVRWRSHPEISQGNVQLLLWGITSQAKISNEPAELQAVARVLLSAQEINDLNGGALGALSDLLSKAGLQLPAPVQEVLAAENQVRDLLTHGNPSYEQLAAIAVRPPQSTLDVGRKRWSYDPHGYFIRYLPASYSTTQIQLFVPPPYKIAHDTHGRISSIDDGAGSRLDVQYTSVVQLKLTIPAGYYGFGDHRQHIALGATTLATSNLSAGSQDVRAVDAIARSAELLVTSSKAPFLDKSGASNFLRGAVPALVCRSLGGCNGTRVATTGLVALGPPEFGYDPTVNMASPANAANQPLGQSGQPTSSDKNKDCDRVREQLEFSRQYQLRYNDPNVNAAAAKDNWSGGYYQERIEKQAWDDGAFNAGGEGPGRRGGETNMATCVSTIPTQTEVIAEGLPAMMYDVIKNHEDKHHEDCLKRIADHLPDSWSWRRRTEIDAYYISIQTMEQWIAHNC